MPDARDDPPTEALKQTEIEVIKPAKYSRDPGALRRTGLHNRLLDLRKITPEQWDWCESYARAYEIVSSGGLTGRSSSGKVDEATNSQFWPGSVRAAIWLRAQDVRLSLADRELLVAACVYAARVVDLARRFLELAPRDDETLVQFRARVAGRVERAVRDVIEKALQSV